MTVTGLEKKNFSREKLQILTRWHGGFHVTNTDNLELKCVGFEKKLELKQG